MDVAGNACILISACTGTVRLASLNDFYDFTIFDDRFSVCDTTGTLATCAIEGLGNSTFSIYSCVSCLEIVRDLGLLRWREGWRLSFVYR